MHKNNLSAIKILPVFFAFYAMGFLEIVGVATGYIQSEFGLSDTQKQLFTMMIFVWFALLSIPVGIFQNKRGKKFTVNIGILLTGVGMLIPLLWYSYYGMFISFSLLGIGNTIMQVSAPPLMQDISSSAKLSRNLTLAQFVKATAGMLGPIIAAYCAVTFGSWTLIYWVYLSVCIISIVWLQFTRVEEHKSTENATVKGALRLLSDKKIALLVLGIFQIVGFDVGMNTNIGTYLKTQFAASQEEASVGISIYFAGLMVGRFLSAIILNWISSNKTFLYCTILSVCAFFLLFFMPTSLTTQIVIFCVGLFTASLFPLIFAIGLRYLPNHANELSGLIMMSVCGGAIIPPAIGLLNDRFGINIGLAIQGICLIYMIFLSVYILNTHTNSTK
jgi:fucose permease